MWLFYRLKLSIHLMILQYISHREYFAYQSHYHRFWLNVNFWHENSFVDSNPRNIHQYPTNMNYGYDLNHMKLKISVFQPYLAQACTEKYLTHLELQPVSTCFKERHEAMFCLMTIYNSLALSCFILKLILIFDIAPSWL